MYSIYADGECVYNDGYVSEAYKVTSPKLKMADSAAGSLEMVLPPTNNCYDKLKRMTSTIVVKRYDEEIWEGRIVEDSYNFYNERSIYCEGALAYLNDTCQPQREYTNFLLEQFLQSVFDIHNSKVREDRKLYYDFQNVTAEYIERRVTQYEKTLETLNKVCEDYECHMRIVRREVNIAGDGEDPIYVTRKYVQFFKGPANTTAQIVEFGKNLLDYSSNYNLSDLATVVLPLGAAKERESSGSVGQSIDLTKVSTLGPNQGVGDVIEDVGYFVYKAISDDYSCINFKDQIEQGADRIITIPGGISYNTAVLAIKASTKVNNEDKKNTVYLSSRMHGGRGMYMWYTPKNFDPILNPQGGTFHSGEWADTSSGFTDAVEKALEVPYADAQYAQGYYILYIGSFGGDIQFRLNLQTDISDETLDEYYTAEDAMVSEYAVRTTIPALENGNLSVDSAHIGENVDDGNLLYLRTTGWIRDETNVPFDEGLYNVNVTTSNNKLVQARVFHSSVTSDEKYYDGWKNVPARFTVGSDKYEGIRIVFRYADQKTEIRDTDITGFTINKGKMYGSLYVTAQSKNLFNDTVDRGEIIDSGDLIGEDSSQTSLIQLRSQKKLSRINLDGVSQGFEPGNYLLSSTVTRASDDDNRIAQVRIFHYDFTTGDYVSMDDWDIMPKAFTVPDNTSQSLKFAFRFADESNISVSSITDIQLEQGVTTPSLYEQPNTALEEYGWIETCMSFDDVTDPDILYYKAKQYLSSGQFDHMTLDVKALDLAVLGVNIEAVNVNDYIRVRSRPHGLDRYFEVTEIDIPLDEPENMTFSLGAETEQTLTSINNNLNDDLLKMIEDTPSMGAILKTAKTESDKILRDGFANSYMVVILDDDDHPNGLGFFKIPAADPDDDPTPTNNIPDAHWSNINGNPAYNTTQVLLINDAGIGFYGNGLDDDPTITLVNAKGQIVADAVVAGTMLADRMRGGTLALGHWIIDDGTPGGQSNPGVLHVLADQNDSIINEEWSSHMIEMTKDVGFTQQGRASDGIFRQLKMFDGILSGSVYYEPSNPDAGWHVGGELLMCAVYGNQGSLSYGVELRSRYITAISSTNNIELNSQDGSIYLSPHQGNDTGIYVLPSRGQYPLKGYDDPVEVLDWQGNQMTLHFTHGILTGVT